MDGLFDEQVISGSASDPPGGEHDSEAAVPSAAEADDTATRVAGIVEAGVARIEGVLESKHALDCFREAQVDRLHAELQDYRNDLVGKVVRPVFRSMIRLHDDIGKVLDALGRDELEALSAERMLGLLRGFRDDIEIALDQHGVTTFRLPTEEFDPRRQTVARTIKTDEPARVGHIAGRVNPGFESGDAVLQKERVAVYVAMGSSSTAGG